MLRLFLLFLWLTLSSNWLCAQGIPLGRMVTLSDFGSEDLAYLAVPNTPPTLGVVLVPDAYGLDHYTKLQADRLAAQGFLVVAVDLYSGHVVTEQSQVDNIAANLDGDLAVKTITAGIQLFKQSPRFRTVHVAAVGWGVGAKNLLQVTRTNKTLEGAALFYGPIETKQLDHLDKLNAAICALYATKDADTPHDAVLAYQHGMRAAGNNFDAWFIEGGRGWSNPANVNYNPGEDEEAWKVVIPFLQRISIAPARPEEKPSILNKMGDFFK